MKPLVSVVIPNYNHAAYLAERIQSVLDQTYPEIEVILLDDCSTDNSVEIMEQFKQSPRVSQIVRNERNSGSPFRQWGKGIGLAKGDYVWIAESDDCAKPAMVAALVEALEDNPDAVVAFCGSTVSYQAYRGPDKETSGFEKHDGIDFLNQHMLVTPKIKNASAVIFRRAAVQPGILDVIAGFRYAGDWAFWSYLLGRGSILETSGVLNFFRRHPESTARKADLSGAFVSEGLQVVAFIRHGLGHRIPMTALRIWASVWAQYYIVLKRKGIAIFRKNLSKAWSVSPWLIAGFCFYFIKFQLFTKINITH